MSVLNGSSAPTTPNAPSRTVPAFAPDRARRRYRLSGPRAAIDPRNRAVLGDVADIALADRIAVPHYVEPVIRRCAAVTSMIRAEAADDARALSELIHGEDFAVLVEGPAFAWGYRPDDGYVGHVALADLTDRVAPTHRVVARAALLFAAADIKAPVVARLPMGACLAVDDADDHGAFLRCADGWVHHRHVAPYDAAAPDPVTLAEQLVGAPYLWGGRSGDGLDCSGLVQLTLALAGTLAPRDSDQQLAMLGDGLCATTPLRRGDLIFLPGHVAMMVDDDRVVHANAHWMQVTVEPLVAMLARQPEGEAAIIGRRRLAR